MSESRARRDAPISVGDLVVQVRECCATDSELGDIYRVGEIRWHPVRCYACGYSYLGLVAYDVERPYRENWGAPPIHWLKRIPPLSDLEGEKREEELHVG